MGWRPRWFIVVFLFVTPTPAWGQETGGSFGGGDFSGGSSDWGGSSSSGWGSSSSDWGSSSSDWGSSSSSDWGSSGGGRLSSGAGIVFLIVGITIVMIAVMIRQHGRRPIVTPIVDLTPEGWGGIDVTALTLAIDWRARKDVQARLAALARSGESATREGRRRLLEETAILMRRAEMSWLYAGARNAAPMGSPAAESAFRALAAEARSRYRKEVVRGDAGGVQVEPVATRARSEEGPGVVVVTLVVAARRSLVDVHDVRDARQIRAALHALTGLTTAELVALEVIWSPAEEDDRMSSAELETLYPELVKLAPESIAGRVFCSYCGGPFAAELLRCPHCAAPLERPST